MKVYAWNFTPMRDGLLVRRGISNDSIGVVKLEAGWLEFWSMGDLWVRTRSWTVLCRVIAKVERRT